VPVHDAGNESVTTGNVSILVCRSWKPWSLMKDRSSYGMDRCHDPQVQPVSACTPMH
jgi:hypothetical protein